MCAVTAIELILSSVVPVSWDAIVRHYSVLKILMTKYVQCLLQNILGHRFELDKLSLRTMQELRR